MRLPLFVGVAFVVVLMGLLAPQARSQDAPTCIDDKKNGEETDVDCGGGKCPKCATGKACAASSDCRSGSCVSGICDLAVTASCIDNQKNASETDVDCGGGKCPKCALGKACAADSDCQSAACTSGACTLPVRVSCIDGQKNGEETDVDCGGPKCSKCDGSKTCAADRDCKSGSCKDSVCTGASASATCYDNQKNGQETDVDCGGPKCPGCNAGKQCQAKGDCRSRNCKDGTCAE